MRGETGDRRLESGDKRQDTGKGTLRKTVMGETGGKRQELRDS